MVTRLTDAEFKELRDPLTRSPGFFADPSKIDNANIQNQPKNPPGRSVSARVFPNGEFSVGFVPPKGISAKDRRYEEDRRYAEDNAEIHADIEIDESLPEGFKYTRTKVLPLPPKLGLGSESSQEVKKYGKKGITSYGRKMVRNGGDVLQKSVDGRYNRLLVMGTLTVPSYSEESMLNISRNWSNITRRFYQECKREYARKRYRFDYVGVTEIQPKRLQERGELGLHIHFLYVAIRLGRGKWVLHDSWVRNKWGHILADYLGENEPVQLPNYRRESVKTSAAAYLSKYLSKGGEQVQQVAEQFGEEYIPSQWWTISHDLRQCIHKHTISSQSTQAEVLMCICTQEMSEYYRYIRKATLETMTNQYAEVHKCPTEVLLGYGGLLSTEGKSLFIPSNQSQSIKQYLPRTLDKTGAN